jgi:hypothetical protein
MSQSAHFAVAEAAEREAAAAVPVERIAESNAEVVPIRVAAPAMENDGAGVENDGAGVETEIYADPGFTTSTSLQTLDMKLDNRNWTRFVGSIQTGKDYVARITDFEVYNNGAENKTPGAPLVDSLTDYFDVRRAETKKEKEGSGLICKHAGTTMQGWYSMFKRYFDLVHAVDIDKECKIIQLQLAGWQKTQKVVKAKTYKKADMGKKISLCKHVWVIISYFIYRNTILIHSGAAQLCGHTRYSVLQGLLCSGVRLRGSRS